MQRGFLQNVAWFCYVLFFGRNIVAAIAAEPRVAIQPTAAESWEFMAVAFPEMG